MMTAAVRTVDGLPETGHFTLRGVKVSAGLMQFLLQGFYDVVYQDPCGMLSVVHTHRLGFSICTLNLCTGLLHALTERQHRQKATYKAAAKHNVQDFADFHFL